jgi:hypothetical protein
LLVTVALVTGLELPTLPAIGGMAVSSESTGLDQMEKCPVPAATSPLAAAWTALTNAELQVPCAVRNVPDIGTMKVLPRSLRVPTMPLVFQRTAMPLGAL